MNGNDVRDWFFGWWKDLFSNAQKGAIWEQYKECFNSLNNAKDSEILQIAEQQLNSILIGNNLTSDQRALISSRIQFEYKHQERKASYAKILTSSLTDLVPSNFPNYGKTFDDNGNVIESLTWGEYPSIIYEAGSYSYLSIGHLKQFNGVRNNEIEFEEWKVWYDYFGKDNILSHTSVMSLLV